MQRRLRAPLTSLAGVTRSRTYGKLVDAYGDVYQNDGVHSSRHALVLKKWHRAIRAAYGGTGVVMEDTRHGVYCPSVQPDITRKHGCVGTPYVIYDPDDPDPARRFKMWYAGSSNRGTTGMVKSVTQVAFAASPDGVAWTAVNGGEPVFSMQGQRKVFPSGGNAYMVVKKYDGVYYMWFAPLDDKVSHPAAGYPPSSVS